MCGFCKAMTAKEAATFYAHLKTGTVTAIPGHVITGETPRKDLLSRQEEELQLGAFQDQPAFRRELVDLCAYARKRDMSMYDFEVEMVGIRQKYGQVMSDEDMQRAIVEAEARKAAPPPLPRRSVMERVLEAVGVGGRSS